MLFSNTFMAITLCQHLSSDCYSSNLTKCGKTTGRNVNKENLCAMRLSVFVKVHICIVCKFNILSKHSKSNKPWLAAAEHGILVQVHKCH